MGFSNPKSRSEVNQDASKEKSSSSETGRQEGRSETGRQGQEEVVVSD
jgi:hypothetical protein